MVDNARYGIYRTVVEGGGNFVFVNPAMIKMMMRELLLDTTFVTSSRVRALPYSGESLCLNRSNRRRG